MELKNWVLPHQILTEDEAPTVSFLANTGNIGRIYTHEGGVVIERRANPESAYEPWLFCCGSHWGKIAAKPAAKKGASK